MRTIPGKGTPGTPPTARSGRGACWRLPGFFPGSRWTQPEKATGSHFHVGPSPTRRGLWVASYVAQVADRGGDPGVLGPGYGNWISAYFWI